MYIRYTQVEHCAFRITFYIFVAQNKQGSGRIPERNVVHIKGSMMQLNSDLVTMEVVKNSKPIVVFKESITQTFRPPLETQNINTRQDGSTLKPKSNLTAQTLQQKSGLHQCISFPDLLLPFYLALLEHCL